MRLLEISSLVRFILDYGTVHAFGIKLHVSILGIYSTAYGAVILYSGYICRNHGGYAYGSLARNSLTLRTNRNPGYFGIGRFISGKPASQVFNG